MRVKTIPLSKITEFLKNKSKPQKEIIDLISSKKNQSPRKSFFKHLQREFGRKDMEDFKKVLEDNRRFYTSRLLKEVYDEIDLEKVLKETELIEDEI